MLAGLRIAIDVPHPVARRVAGTHRQYLAGIEGQIFTRKLAADGYGAGIGIGGIEADPIQAVRQFAEIVVQSQLDALMFGGAQRGPADGVVDVLQLIIKINVESRQLRFE